MIMGKDVVLRLADYRDKYGDPKLNGHFPVQCSDGWWVMLPGGHLPSPDTQPGKKKKKKTKNFPKNNENALARDPFEFQ